jgi:hypothetical protein
MKGRFEIKEADSQGRPGWRVRTESHPSCRNRNGEYPFGLPDRISGNHVGNDASFSLGSADMILESIAGLYGPLRGQGPVHEACMIAVATARSEPCRRDRVAFLSALCCKAGNRHIIGAEGAHGGSFLGGHLGAKEIRDGDGGNDQNEGEEGNAQGAKNTSGRGQALAFKTSSALADFRKRQMAEDHNHNGGRQEENENAADAATDRLAAGGRFTKRRRSAGEAGGDGGNHRGSHFCAALGAELGTVGDRFSAIRAGPESSMALPIRLAKRSERTVFCWTIAQVAPGVQ